MRRVAALLAVTTAIVLTGCNTIHGVGRDIEAAGNAIQRTTR